MTVEFDVHDGIYARDSRPYLTAHDNEFLNAKARFACDLVVSWGMPWASADYKVDLDGGYTRMAHRPEHIVRRAMEITERLWEAFGDYGWIIDMPTLNEATAIIEANKNLSD